MGNWFEKLQSIGMSLMLPIAVLPAAALLLRLGAPDVLNIPFITKAGGSIFDNLALIFSIGIAVGLAKDSNGAAGLAGAIAYLVLTSGLKAIDPALDMSVLAGILSGIEAGVLYNRFHDIRLPEFLGFFGGRRFVPIAAAIVSILFALLFGVIWGPCQAFIHAIGEWIIGAGVVGTFVYGVLNRLLIPFGLHHILNSFIWFVFGSYRLADGTVATGDLNRFFAGDPHAGMFMGGFYIMMMFGMPAVALAMYHEAKKENRHKIAGALASVAFTSFLTGITEPIEFLFMFIAPVLYGIHAVLTGLAMSVAYAFGILHGFGFSAGFIDYVLNWGLATKPWLILPIGLVFGLIYYVVFRWMIRFYDLPTIGRGDDVEFEESSDEEVLSNAYVAMLVENLGGLDNLVEIGSCVTRLRLKVKDPSKIDEEVLRHMGVRGVFSSGTAVQVVVGTRAELIANAIKEMGRR